MRHRWVTRACHFGRSSLQSSCGNVCSCAPAVPLPPAPGVRACSLTVVHLPPALARLGPPACPPAPRLDGLASWWCRVQGWGGWGVMVWWGVMVCRPSCLGPAHAAAARRKFAARRGERASHGRRRAWLRGPWVPVALYVHVLRRRTSLALGEAPPASCLRAALAGALSPLSASGLVPRPSHPMISTTTIE
jgi:hypothetical protein